MYVYSCVYIYRGRERETLANRFTPLLNNTTDDNKCTECCVHRVQELLTHKWGW